MLKKILTLILCLLPAVKAQQVVNVNELSLISAVNIALENNQVLKISQSEIDASRGRFWQNTWLPSPEVSLTYEAVPLHTPIKNYGERYIELSQSVDYPAGIYFRSKSFAKAIDASKEWLNSQRHLITIQVKRRYYEALASIEKVKANEENLELLRSFLEKSEARLKLGEGTNLETLTAKVQHKEALNLLEESRNNQRNAMNNLALAMGISSREIENADLSDSLNSRQYEISLDELISRAENNSFIRTAELNLSKAQYDNKYAWAKLLPGFNLAYSREAIGSNNNYYGVSLGVKVPLWFMFNEKGDIQEASANQRSAEHELALTKNETITGIKNSFNDYQNQKNQLAAYKKEILPLSEEVYRIAKASYDAGEITYLELMQAQQTLISAQNNFIDVMLNYNHALLSLEEAAGYTLSTNISYGERNEN